MSEDFLLSTTLSLVSSLDARTAAAAPIAVASPPSRCMHRVSVTYRHKIEKLPSAPHVCVCIRLTQVLVSETHENGV